jgi:hypothetical protein
MTLTLSLKVTDHVQNISLGIPYRLSIISMDDLEMTLRKFLAAGGTAPRPTTPNKLLPTPLVQVPIKPVRYLRR